MHELAEVPSGLPEALHDRMGEMLEALHGEDWARAETLGRELEKAAPRCPQVLQNLATALSQLGKDAEGEALLRRALEIDPNYLFAAATLALICMDRGQLDEARALLRGLRLGEQVNPAAYAFHLVADCRVALAEGDPDAAARSWETARKIDPDHPAVAALEDDLTIRILEMRADMERRREARRERLRRHILGRDAGLAQCLEPLTVDELKDMARALGTGTSGRKDELRDRVAAAAAAAPVPADAALRPLAEAGGVLAHDEFTRAHGVAALERLRLLGLLAEGAVGGRPSILIPAERRAAVAAAMGPRP